jgi:hypothetical protein
LASGGGCCCVARAASGAEVVQHFFLLPDGRLPLLIEQLRGSFLGGLFGLLKFLAGFLRRLRILAELSNLLTNFCLAGDQLVGLGLRQVCLLRGIVELLLLVDHPLDGVGRRFSIGFNNSLQFFHLHQEGLQAADNCPLAANRIGKLRRAERVLGVLHFRIDATALQQAQAFGGLGAEGAGPTADFEQRFLELPIERSNVALVLDGG